MHSVAAGIVFALPIEAGRFTDRVASATRTEAAGLSLHEGRLRGHDVAWVVGGVGTDRAARACRLLIDGHRPRILISAGFAGGLAPDVGRGSVVSPSWAVTVGGERLDLSPGDPAVGVTGGGIVTVDRVIGSVEEKRRLAHATDAAIVDMETWGVASVALSARLPCACVRVVSDTASDELPPEIARLTEAPSPWRRVGAALRTIGGRPRAVLDLWTLWERAVIDSRTLADALEQRVAALPATAR